MASTATPSSDEQFSTVLVHKEKNTVLFAEAGKDFVDVLLSFLTLPLGTIARLVSMESNIEPVRVGSLSSLYQSVTVLDEQYLCSQTCKEMLLQPKNSMEAYCQNLKLNIDDTEPTTYFACENWNCNRVKTRSLLSTFRNQRCHCGEIMNKVMDPKNETPEIPNGFVMETATLIICDDPSVLPNAVTNVDLLRTLGVEDIAVLEEQILHISKKEGKISVTMVVKQVKDLKVGKSSRSRGFTKGASMFMVTDDLIVSPASSVSGVSYINRLKVLLFDLEEKIIRIGSKEGLGILKASLTSTSALTESQTLVQNH
ncbi:hypothetical protein RJT34_17517 [Clitoria ternatea]|uniref:DUF674 domain-containing protein n=1 Tax=Clitoria ternatea TaxID=43366 RepID=A0AAN9JBA3_CLITE